MGNKKNKNGTGRRDGHDTESFCRWSRKMIAILN